MEGVLQRVRPMHCNHRWHIQEVMTESGMTLGVTKGDRPLYERRGRQGTESRGEWRDDLPVD